MSSEAFKRIMARNTALKAMSGIGGASINRVSINKGHWNLINADGTIHAIETNFLDVIILDVNVHTSRLWYEGDYNSKSTEPPACFSHNGIGPSTDCTKPQAETCEECPLSRWDSSFNKATGKSRPACGERKLAAVVAVAYPNKVYQLNIPPTSLGNFRAYVSDLLKHVHPRAGVPLDLTHLVTRLSFDTSPKVAGQRILFARGDLLTDDAVVWVADLLDTNEQDKYTMIKDKPRTGALPKPAERPALASPAAAAKMAEAAKQPHADGRPFAFTGAPPSPSSVAPVTGFRTPNGVEAQQEPPKSAHPTFVTEGDPTLDSDLAAMGFPSQS